MIQNSLIKVRKLSCHFSSSHLNIYILIVIAQHVKTSSPVYCQYRDNKGLTCIDLQMVTQIVSAEIKDEQ